MLAWELRESKVCARLSWRGMVSMPTTVALLRARSAKIVSLFLAGWMWETRVTPSFMSLTSSLLGGLILSTRSEPRAAPVPTTRAPAAVYASSGNSAAAPAPLSTSTSLNPSFSSVATPAGVMATRFSLGKVSLGTPTEIWLYGMGVCCTWFSGTSLAGCVVRGLTGVATAQICKRRTGSRGALDCRVLELDLRPAVSFPGCSSSPAWGTEAPSCWLRSIVLVFIVAPLTRKARQRSIKS
mmetsp:Transcript_1350/g.2939  ORF Transcript_1350/g.2939 Transcript_1350/m.2939 type:complete len:240 (+) Transcript_1350:772-1491(+)